MAACHRVFAFACLVSAALLPPGSYARERDLSVYDISTDATAQLPAYVDVARRRHATAIKRIAIVSFTVEFIDSRAPGAASPPKGDEQKAQPVIAGIAITLDLAQLRPIADTLYDLAAEDLRGAGVEVLTADEVSALPGYATLKAALIATPYRLDGSDEQGRRTSVVVSAHGLPAYRATGRSPSAASETEIAKRGNVAVLHAHLVVDFLTLRDSDGRLFRSKLVPRYVEMVRAVETRYRIVASDASITTAELRKAVRAPESPVALSRLGDPTTEDHSDEADEDASSDSKDSPGESARAVIERITINPAVYYDQALRYLGAAQDMLLGALAASP